MGSARSDSGLVLDVCRKAQLGEVVLCLYFCFVLFPLKRTAIAMRPGGMKTHTQGGLGVRISVLRRVRELRVVHA